MSSAEKLLIMVQKLAENLKLIRSSAPCHFLYRSFRVSVYRAFTQCIRGYAEQVLVQSSPSFEVPNGLDADNATMTEPMAVALHAVHRSRIKTNEPAIVIGCGPVGLGIYPSCSKLWG